MILNSRTLILLKENPWGGDQKLFFIARKAASFFTVGGGGLVKLGLTNGEYQAGSWHIESNFILFPLQ